MHIKVKEIIPVQIEGEQYTVNPKHRSNKAKSDCTQWIVVEDDEKVYFGNAVKDKYLCEKNCYWWVEIKALEGKPIPIGKTNTQFAYIAKFVSDRNEIWHGYPVTAERSPHDVPASYILKMWRDLKIFSKSEINKIEGGRGYVKACN